ncbi:MAG: iron-containing alcohol dehydrogenase [Victivallales bacterium]|nr:iron-containing alcohol dehydrogenase [Victivallales bacterium]
MPTSYSTFLPSRLHFGCGTRRKVSAELDSLADGGVPPRVLLVASRSVRQSPLGEELAASLGARLAGEFVGVPHDPPVTTVDEIRQSARQCNANAMVALGGGSVMDAAKTAALLAWRDEPTVAFHRGEVTVSDRGLPLIALPTTAGTGAEITKNAVLTDVEREYKGSIKTPAMVPSVAIIDPEFTLGLPRRVTADSGLDALTQAIESYVSSGANALTQALAKQATALLLRWLPLAWENGQDAAARSGAAEGAMISAMAFSQSGLGAVHGLAHPIGHRLGLAHGFTCAVLLPQVIRFNLPICRQQFDALAAESGCGDSTGLLERVDWLCRHLQVPATLPNLQESDLGYIVKNCRSGSMKANPRPMSDDDVIGLLQRLM